MIGFGMIFDEAYRTFFEAVAERPLWTPEFGRCDVVLAAAASRTGRRAETYRQQAPPKVESFQSFHRPEAVSQLLTACTRLPTAV